MEDRPDDAPWLKPSEAISTAVRYYRRHFRTIVGLLLPPAIVLLGLDAVFGWRFGADSFLYSLVVLILNIPLQAALLYVFAAEGVPEGKPILSAYAKVAGKLPRLYFAYFLLNMLFAPVLPVFSLEDRGTLYVCFALAAIVFIYASARCVLVVPEIVVRDARLWDAVRFSWRETRQRFMTVLGISIVSQLVSWVSILPIMACVLVLHMVIPDSEMEFFLGRMLRILRLLVTVPFTTGNQMVIYQKISSEAADRPQAAASDSAGGAGG